MWEPGADRERGPLPQPVYAANLMSLLQVLSKSGGKGAHLNVVGTGCAQGVDRVDNMGANTWVDNIGDNMGGRGVNRVQSGCAQGVLGGVNSASSPLVL